MATPSLEGVYCFPWPDTGQISSVQYFDCAALGKTSVAMSLERFNEFVAASAGTETPPAVDSFTAAEVAALKYQAANPSPFNLSMSDGALVASAICATWAVAWGVRQLVRALSVDGEKE